MNKTALVELLTELAGDAIAGANAVEDGLMTRVRDGMHGHPRSPSFDAGQSTAKPPKDDDPESPRSYLEPSLRGRDTHSDPTGTAAVQALDYGDQAEVDRRQLIKDAKAARLAMARFVRTAAKYNPRAPSAIDKQEDQAEDRGCESCARVDSPGTVGKPRNERTPWWNPTHVVTTLADGSQVRVCRWCADGEVGTRKTGTLPEKDDVMAYRDTGRARKRTA